MNNRCFSEAIKEIEGYFSLKYHPKAIGDFWERVKDMPDAAMGRAGNRIFNEYTNRDKLTLERVQKIVLEERAKMREEEWKEQKGEDSRGRVDRSTFLTEEQSSAFAKSASTIIRMILCDMPREKIQDGLNFMAKHYPRSGYPLMARSYQEHGDFRLYEGR